MSFSLIIIILCILALLICAVAIYGNEYLFVMHMTMSEAIYLYNMDCLKNKEITKPYFIDHEDIKDWTILECACPWMWKIERYLSEEKLIILKPYLLAAVKEVGEENEI